MTDNKQFYKRLLILTLPIVIQNLITTSLNMLDTLMIGSLGEVELAAVGVANQFYFLYSLLVMGVGAGCSILIAQLWGKKDEEKIHSVLKLGLIGATGFALVFMFIGFFASEQIIALFNSDSQVVRRKFCGAIHTHRVLGAIKHRMMHHKHLTQIILALAHTQ